MINRCCRYLATIVFVLVASFAQAQAPIAGKWKLVEDDSDNIFKEWSDLVREKLRRDARRAPSQSPMLMAANPNQQINLPWFLARFRNTEISLAGDVVVFVQSGNRDVKKAPHPGSIRREVNLNPAATTISLRDAARRPPTMFIGGWEKNALVIETTIDDGLMIEEHWTVEKDDDELFLHRSVQLRSSIWGDHEFEQIMEQVRD